MFEGLNTQGADTVEDLGTAELAALIVDLIHRLAVHQGLWFAEAERQLGMERALEILSASWAKSYPLQAARLGQCLGFALEQGLPAPLLRLSRRSLLGLVDDLAKNWLANDGLWFQSVEFTSGMFDAKRTNDSCWVRFSPVEAQAVRTFLGLGARSGIEGLRRALAFRLYARINRQSVRLEGPNRLVFEMNECRVQAARSRKGLEDYPCKSVGMVEYPAFARTIDPRLVTECLGCPPDPHPKEWFCAWRFTLEDPREDAPTEARTPAAGAA